MRERPIDRDASWQLPQAIDPTLRNRPQEAKMERGVEVFGSINGSRHGERLSIPVGQANRGGVDYGRWR